MVAGTPVDDGRAAAVASISGGTQTPAPLAFPFSFPIHGVLPNTPQLLLPVRLAPRAWNASHLSPGSKALPLQGPCPRQLCCAACQMPPRPLGRRAPVRGALVGAGPGGPSPGEGVRVRRQHGACLGCGPSPDLCPWDFPSPCIPLTESRYQDSVTPWAHPPGQPGKAAQPPQGAVITSSLVTDYSARRCSARAAWKRHSGSVFVRRFLFCVFSVQPGFSGDSFLGLPSLSSAPPALCMCTWLSRLLCHPVSLGGLRPSEGLHRGGGTVRTQGGWWLGLGWTRATEPVRWARRCGRTGGHNRGAAYSQDK